MFVTRTRISGKKAKLHKCTVYFDWLAVVSIGTSKSSSITIPSHFSHSSLSLQSLRSRSSLLHFLFLVSWRSFCITILFDISDFFLGVFPWWKIMLEISAARHESTSCSLKLPALLFRARVWSLLWCNWVIYRFCASESICELWISG